MAYQSLEDRVFNPTLSRSELVVWAILATLVVLTVSFRNGIRLSNDGFQYLSTAENIAAGQGIVTSIVYFDEQRHSNHLPAPQTVFPSGYPLAIAGLLRFGLVAEIAGWIIAAGSGILLVFVFLLIGSWLAISPFFLRCSALILLTNDEAVLLTRSVLSESLFALVALIGLACLLAAEQRDEVNCSGLTYRLAGGLVVGLACWVKYAGIFLVVGTVFAHALWWLIVRDWRSLRNVVAAGAGVPLVLVLFARNYRLSGSPWGGNTKRVSHALPDVIRELVGSSRDLMLGHGSLRIGSLNFALLSLLIAVILYFGWILLVARRSCQIRGSWLVHNRFSLLLIACWTGVYLVCLVYAGKTSVVSFADPRMLYPILPALGLLFGLLSNRLSWATWGDKKILRRAAFVGVGCMVLLHLRGIWQPVPRPDRIIAVRNAVRAPFEQEASLAAWFAATNRAARPVLAADGQAFGYYARQKVVALTNAHFSTATWSESEVRELAQKYQASYLILFPKAPETIDLCRESPFLEQIQTGLDLPAWISLAASNSTTRVYRVDLQSP